MREETRLEDLMLQVLPKLWRIEKRRLAILQGEICGECDSTEDHRNSTLVPMCPKGCAKTLSYEVWFSGTILREPTTSALGTVHDESTPHVMVSV